MTDEYADALYVELIKLCSQYGMITPHTEDLLDAVIESIVPEEE